MVVRAMRRSWITRFLFWYGEVTGPVTGESVRSTMSFPVFRPAAGSPTP